MSLIENIKMWWRWEARHYHRDFIKGIKNLIRWFPVIWKDRDWDDHFIWQVMIQKLRFQAKYIGDRDFHTRAKRDAEIMMTCVRLMEKIKEEYYATEYFDYHETEYTWEDSDEPGFVTLNVEEKSERFDEYFKKYPLVYKRIKQRYTNEDKSRLAFYMSTENHNRARRILFKLMERNIEAWWE